jgi:hypothetical protein
MIAMTETPHTTPDPRDHHDEDLGEEEDTIAGPLGNEEDEPVDAEEEPDGGEDPSFS